MSDALDKARAARNAWTDTDVCGATVLEMIDAAVRLDAALRDLIAEHGRLTALYPLSEKRTKTDNAPPTDDAEQEVRDVERLADRMDEARGERIMIHANSNTSRGKFAAAAVHAALTAAGVHPGCPVIVLGAKPRDIENLTTVIYDAGKTEVEPGTITAGTDWTPTPPTDDERAALAKALLGVTSDFILDLSFPRQEHAQNVADTVLASDVWRNRGRGPVTDAMVDALTQDPTDRSST